MFTGCPYPNAVNGSLWSLPVEFAMYLILPLLLVVAKKLGSTRWGMFTMWLLSLAASVAFMVLRSKGSVLLVVWGNNLPDALPLMPYFFFGSVFSFPQPTCPGDEGVRRGEAWSKAVLQQER